MSELKAKPITASVAAFLKSAENTVQRSDCRELSRLLRKITSKQPKM